MMRRSVLGALLLTLVLALVAAGCGGGGDEEGDKADCGAPPAAMQGVPSGLPTGFPTVDGVVYTGEETSGPSKIVKGYYDGDIDAAYEAWKDAISGASGYSVTKDEKESDDAEVNFDGGGATGQVALFESCKGRTDITITVRPE